MEIDEEEKYTSFIIHTKQEKSYKLSHDVREFKDIST